MDNSHCCTGISALLPERERGSSMYDICPLIPHFLTQMTSVFSAIKANLKHTLNDIVQRSDVASAQQVRTALQAYRGELLNLSMEILLQVVTPQLTSSQYRHSNSLRKCLSNDDKPLRVIFRKRCSLHHSANIAHI